MSAGRWWSVFFIVVAAPVCAAEPVVKPKFPLGRETTFVDGPLDADGYVDYAAALNTRYGRGVAPEDNANVALWQVIGPKAVRERRSAEYFRAMGMEPPADDGTYFVPLDRYLSDYTTLDSDQKDSIHEQASSAMDGPWQAAECPQLAAWLTMNEAPLARLHKAARRPKFFRPTIVDREKRPREWLLATLIVNEFGAFRDLARTLITRAMLRLDQRRYADAWSDLLTCHRLGRLISQGPCIIDDMVGTTLDSMACYADKIFLQEAKLTSTQCRRCMDDLEQLPPPSPLADKFDLAERFIFLDAVQVTSRGDPQILAAMVDGVKDPTPRALSEIVQTDFAPALRLGNVWHDRIVAALRLPYRVARAAELERIAADLKRLEPTEFKQKADRRRASKLLAGFINAEVIGEVVLNGLSAAYVFILNHRDSVEQHLAILRVGFALAAYQVDHGRYPDALSSLQPVYLLQIPKDAFADRPLTYRRDGSSLLLYSVGIDGEDDGGRDYADNDRDFADLDYDDIRIRLSKRE